MEKNIIISLEDHYLYSKIWDTLPQYLKDKYEIMKAPLIDIAEGRINQMDAAGIDFSVLSHVEPGVKYAKNIEEAIELARDTNNYLYAAISKYPKRLGGFAVLPVQSPKDAAVELERAVIELGFKGALIDGHFNGVYLDDDSFSVLLKKAEELNVPIYIHPTNPPEKISKEYFENNDVLITGFAWQVETSLHIIKMINKGIFDKYPNLKIIIGHMGEFIPYGFTRLNIALSVGNWVLKNDNAPKMNLHYYFKNNIYITSSGVFDEPVFNCAKEMIGIDNIMFSVDFPFKDKIEATDFLNKLSLNDKERKQFSSENASILLKLNNDIKIKKKTNNKFSIFKIKLKGKIGKFLISKLVK